MVLTTSMKATALLVAVEGNHQADAGNIAAVLEAHALTKGLHLDRRVTERHVVTRREKERLEFLL